MLRASKPMLGKMSIEEEDGQLGELYSECHAFLRKWQAYKYTTEDEPDDAFIAVSELQRDIVARRGYIAGLLHSDELPF